MNISNHNVAKPKEFRTEIIAFLELLAKPELGAALFENTPADAVPLELARLWFDELYLPAQTDSNGNIRARQNPTAEQKFQQAFSAKEHEVLERFHRFYELRLKMAERAVGGLSELHDSPLWDHMQREARIARSFFP